MINEGKHAYVSEQQDEEKARRTYDDGGGRERSMNAADHGNVPKWASPSSLRPNTHARRLEVKEGITITTILMDILGI